MTEYINLKLSDIPMRPVGPWDMDGNLLSEDELIPYIKWATVSNKRIVGITHIGWLRVSTVYMNGSEVGAYLPSSNLPPMIYETMIFNDRIKKGHLWPEPLWSIGHPGPRTDARMFHRRVVKAISERTLELEVQ